MRLGPRLVGRDGVPSSVNEDDGRMTRVETPPIEETALASDAPASDDAARALLRRLAPYAPLLLVGFAVAFGAWLLRAEVRVAAFPNDETVHSAMSRVA